MKPWLIVAVSAMVFYAPSASRAGDVSHMPASQTSIEFVPVGDVGNVADSTGYGAVDYAYQFGKYHITSAQYCVFLNAVAAADPYGLYNTNMAVGKLAACGIARSGNPGSYAYSVANGYDNFPVNYVSWGSAARFVNWLNNGQPSEPEGPGTTDTGAYTLNGAVTAAALNAVVRNPGYPYYIPTEDEQYKALYYRGGSTNAGYWHYSTRSDSAPSNVLSTSGANNANYKVGSSNTDPVHLLTPVGAFASTVGPYGEYDPAGDLWQWNEALIHVSGFTVAGDRGGGFNDSASFIVSTFRNARNQRSDANYDIGFRIAEIPEPVSIGFILSAARSANDIVLSFPTLAGRHYRLDYKTDLSAAGWSVWLPSVVGTGGQVSVTNAPPSSTAAFFRAARTD